jgi:pimeloyl-ACP methyl ester carboxylesterase
MPILTIDDVDLFYQVEGNGTPIIFIHPPLLTSANFIYQRQALAKSFQVIVFDIRGHGRSSTGSKKITYPLLVRDIITLLNHLHISRTAIVGYSTGGTVALEALYTYPDRFTCGVMLSAMVAPTNWYIKSLLHLAISLANRSTLPLLAANICWSNADNLDTYRLLFHESRLGNAQRIREYYHYSLMADYCKKLTAIKQPNLLLYGKKDNDFHFDRNQLLQHLPNRSLQMVPNVSHHLPTKAVQTVNKAISDFIKHV